RRWTRRSAARGPRNATLPPPRVAGGGGGGGELAQIFACAPSLSLPRKRGRGRCGTDRRNLKTKLGCALLLLALAADAGAASAGEPYPTRPIRLVVGFGAGGPTDIPARLVADKLGEALGPRGGVGNKPAAAGGVATARGR